MGFFKAIGEFSDFVDGYRFQPKVICPFCHEKRCVKTLVTKAKKGVSGGKATGAILTGGISLLATGLSRKQQVTKAKCENCGSTWEF